MSPLLDQLSDADASELPPRREDSIHRHVRFLIAGRHGHHLSNGFPVSRDHDSLAIPCRLNQG
jgi:hypothetical protein